MFKIKRTIPHRHSHNSGGDEGNSSSKNSNGVREPQLLFTWGPVRKIGQTMGKFGQIRSDISYDPLQLIINPYPLLSSIPPEETFYLGSIVSGGVLILSMRREIPTSCPDPAFEHPFVPAN